MTIPGDFTRRKNWSQSILEELRDIVHVLSADFKILSCSPASSEFLGYQPTELVGNLITDYMHEKDVAMFKKEYQLAYGNKKPLRIYYRLMRKDGKHTSFEASGHFVQNCFIGVARCTNVQATRTMDNLLDLKFENRLLKQRLASLKSQKRSQTARPKPSSAPQGEAERAIGGPMNIDIDDDDVLQDLEEMINDPCVYTLGVSASYDISQSLSLFTGLHYETGERSRGISMGMEGELLTLQPDNTCSVFPSGPEDLAIQERQEDTYDDASGQERRAKKKRVEPEHHVCTDCGTIEAPEWRRGPHGPKTLCNACGLRWRKSSNKLD